MNEIYHLLRKNKRINVKLMHRVIIYVQGCSKLLNKKNKHSKLQLKITFRRTKCIFFYYESIFKEMTNKSDFGHLENLSLMDI